MIRKTTPVHIWELHIPIEVIAKIEAYYSQNDKLIVKKTTSDFTLENNTATTKLTSDETLRFDDSKPVKIQLMVTTLSGEIMGTKVIEKRCHECLCDEAMV